MNVLSKLADLGREIATATRSVQDNIAAMRAQIEAKHTELLHAQTAPLPCEEIADRVRKWVTEQGSFWRTRHASDLVHTFGSPDGPRPHWNATTSMTWGAACAYLGPQLTAALIADVNATEYDAGPSSVERPAVVAKLSRELAELEAEEERAIDEANAAGVKIEHRAEVIARRQNEARARDLTDQAEAARRADEAVVNEHHSGRRATPSPYLVANRPSRHETE